MGKWLLNEAYLDWGRKARDPSSLPSPSSADPDPHSDPALALDLALALGLAVTLALTLTLTLSLVLTLTPTLSKGAWVVANAPVLLLNALCWGFGIPLSMLLLTHTFFACTSTTTYEWLKLEKLEYMQASK